MHGQNNIKKGYHYLYLLTPWSRVLLEKLTSLQLVKKFPAFCETRRFITAFTRARQLSLSWASSIQSIPPHPTSWRSILILFKPGSSKWSLYLRFPLQNPVYASPLPDTCYMPRPSHPSRFNRLKILGEEYRSLSSSLCNFLHSPVTSSLLGPNILLSTLFSNTLSLRSSLIVRDQVSHPYKSTGKIIILCIWPTYYLRMSKHARW